MDIADHAQVVSSRFHEMAMENRRFDLSPAPARKTGPGGEPLCLTCDADITARRVAAPFAIRCVDCQQDHDKRNR